MNGNNTCLSDQIDGYGVAVNKAVLQEGCQRQIREVLTDVQDGIRVFGLGRTQEYCECAYDRLDSIRPIAEACGIEGQVDDAYASLNAIGKTTKKTALPKKLGLEQDKKVGYLPAMIARMENTVEAGKDIDLNKVSFLAEEIQSPRLLAELKDTMRDYMLRLAGDVHEARVNGQYEREEKALVGLLGMSYLPERVLDRPAYQRLKTETLRPLD